ncbi:hypothetical protein IKQ21_01295 [bacterium]|nr:hypothetical protein [bacterium]
MKITNIDSNCPSGKGYLHKSVYKYINTSSANAKKELRAIESKVPKQQFQAAINQIDTMRKTTIANLEAFIKKCHPKTFFVIEQHLGYNASMNLNNKNLKLNYSIPATTLLRMSGVCADSEIISPTRSRRMELFNDYDVRLGDLDLKQIKKFSDELIKVDHACADNAILKSYENQSANEEKSFLGRFSHKKHHKKIENFAREIGA